MTIIKIYLILFINIFICEIIQAQNSFQIFIHTTEDENIYSIIENNIGNYAMVGYRAKASNNNYEAGLIIISDTKGNIIKEKELIKQDTILGFTTIFQKTDGNYICSGKIRKSDEAYTNLFICELDNDLNLVRSKQLNIKKNINIANYLLNSENNLLYYGNIYDDNFPYMSYIYFEISQNLDSINLIYDTTEINSPKPYMSMIEKNNHNGYYVLTEYLGSDTYQHFRILNLNNKFDTIDYKDLNNFVSHYGNFKYFSDTTLIISGKTVGGGKYQNDQIACFIVDTADTDIYYENDFGTPDTSDIPGRIVSMDFTDKNNIFLAGTHIFYYLNPNPPSAPMYYNYIYVALIDNNLNLKKELFYGGSSGYYVYYVKATSDGGCIIVSSKYDYLAHTYERDAIILKTDSLGNLSASIKEPEFTAHNLLLYPNPGTDILHIRTAVQSTGGTITLYDINGKQIIQKNISQTNTDINTENIPSGIYLYRYRLNNKLIETGKWIKN